jgi:flagellar motor switch protein FliN/FliY
MAKRKQFDDPLEGIDPVMEQAFSDFAQQDPLPHIPETVASEPAVESAPPEPVIEPTPSFDEPEIADIEFPPLAQETMGRKVELDLFANIPVGLSVELGRSQISLKEVFELSEGSIIELERLVGEPLDLVVNGQVLAQGEVVAIDNNYGFRVTTVVAQPSL